MVSLKGENPVSGNDIDATSASDWMKYTVGALVIVGTLMGARGFVNMVNDRLNVSENVEDSLPELS